MSPASVILMLLLNLSRLSHQCNKAAVEHKDDHRDVNNDGDVECFQNYDNAAYGRWSELTAETLYPFGHPYSWLTIGKLEDLEGWDCSSWDGIQDKHKYIKQTNL